MEKNSRRNGSWGKTSEGTIVKRNINWKTGKWNNSCKKIGILEDRVNRISNVDSLALNDQRLKACSKVYFQSVCWFSFSVVWHIVELNGIGFNALKTIFSVMWGHILVKRKIISNKRQIRKSDSIKRVSFMNLCNNSL